MTTLDVLLCAAAENPSDDLARLALADHLEESGDPRCLWARSPDLWRWSRPDLGDPLPRMLAAVEDAADEAPLLAGFAKLGPRALAPLLDLLGRGGRVGDRARRAADAVSPGAAVARLGELLRGGDEQRTAAAGMLQEMRSGFEALYPQLFADLRDNNRYRVYDAAKILFRAPIPPAFAGPLREAWRHVLTLDEYDRDILAVLMTVPAGGLADGASFFADEMLDTVRLCGNKGARSVARILRLAPPAEVAAVVARARSPEEAAALLSILGDAG